MTRERYILPPHTKLFIKLSKIFPRTFKLTHYWWNFDELFEIIINCVKEFLVLDFLVPYLEITDDDWKTIFGTCFPARSLRNKVLEKLIPYSELSPREEAFLFNPMCECSDCNYLRQI